MPNSIDFYLSLLKLNGIHICVGIPPKGLEVKNVGLSLQLGRRSVVGSAIGGIPDLFYLPNGTGSVAMREMPIK